MTFQDFLWEGVDVQIWLHTKSLKVVLYSCTSRIPVSFSKPTLEKSQLVDRFKISFIAADVYGDF